MHFISEEALDFCDVQLVPQISDLTSRQDVLLERTFIFEKQDYQFSGIPIMLSNMDSIASLAMSEAFNEFGMLACLHKFHNRKTDRDILIQHLNKIQNSILTIGISDDDYKDFVDIYESTRKRPFWVCVDVANGYTKCFSDFIKKVRYGREEDLIIIAGNVVTKEMTQMILQAGADIVKIGIGSGQNCETRKVTGVGIPQLSAILECADGAHGLGGKIISDGGIREIGDFSKAFCSGADFVMAGGIFSGHEECADKNFGINIIESGFSGERTIVFRGMSSREAMLEHYGGMADYRASEGRQTLVPVKGNIRDTLRSICGGIRSACTYIGARSLKEMGRRATFRKVRRTWI